MVRRYKKRPPRLFKNKKGRYIKTKRRKLYINSPLTSKQLVNVIVGNFEQKTKKRRKKAKKGELSSGSKSGISKTDLVSLIQLITPKAGDPGPPGQLGAIGHQGYDGIPGAPGMHGVDGRNGARGLPGRTLRRNEVEIVRDINNKVSRNSLDAVYHDKFGIAPPAGMHKLDLIYELIDPSNGAPPIINFSRGFGGIVQDLGLEINLSSRRVRQSVSLESSAQPRQATPFRPQTRSRTRSGITSSHDLNNPLISSSSSRSAYSAGESAGPLTILGSVASRPVTSFDDILLGSVEDGEATESEGSGKTKSGKGLYDDEIESIMQKYVNKGFKGVYSIDEVPNIPVSDVMAFIMNLEPSYKSGSHWIAVYIDTKHDKSLEYYDSFADDPSYQFMKNVNILIKKLDPSVYLKFKVNRIVNQRANSSNCGWFAMKFLFDRFAGIPFKECTGYSDVINSEQKIEQFKHKFNYV